MTGGVGFSRGSVYGGRWTRVERVRRKETEAGLWCGRWWRQSGRESRERGFFKTETQWTMRKKKVRRQREGRGGV